MRNVPTDQPLVSACRHETIEKPNGVYLALAAKRLSQTIRKDVFSLQKSGKDSKYRTSTQSPWGGRTLRGKSGASSVEIPKIEKYPKVLKWLWVTQGAALPQEIHQVFFHSFSRHFLPTKVGLNRWGVPRERKLFQGLNSRIEPDMKIQSSPLSNVIHRSLDLFFPHQQSMNR